MPATVSAESPSPERALLSLARDGEREAREELARRVRRPAYLLALQLTGRPDQAQDIAKDSLLRFFQHLDRFDPLVGGAQRIRRSQKSSGFFL